MWKITIQNKIRKLQKDIKCLISRIVYIEENCCDGGGTGDDFMTKDSENEITDDFSLNNSINDGFYFNDGLYIESEDTNSSISLNYDSIGHYVFNDTHKGGFSTRVRKISAGGGGTGGASLRLQGYNYDISKSKTVNLNTPYSETSTKNLWSNLTAPITFEHDDQQSIPISEGENVLVLSVNGEFADEYGNIEIEINSGSSIQSNKQRFTGETIATKTLTQTPKTNSVDVILNGVVLDEQGGDYTVSGTTVTLTTAPLTTDVIVIKYLY